jgi:hypothetical protein
MRQGTAVSPLRLGILGAGDVGLVIGGLLSAAGHDVTFLVRSGRPAPDRIRLEDAKGRRIEAHGFGWTTLAAVDTPPEIVLACVRGEQIEAALREVSAHIPQSVPIVVAAATLDSLVPLAQSAGLSGPILRMGVGFGSFPRADGVHRFYDLTPSGTAIVHEGDPAGRPIRDRLVTALRLAGLRVGGPPPGFFLPMFRMMIALHSAQILGLGRAGWDFGNLARDTALSRLSAQAMREAALAIRHETGLFCALCLPKGEPCALGKGAGTEPADQGHAAGAIQNALGIWAGTTEHRRDERRGIIGGGAGRVVEGNRLVRKLLGTRTPLV